LKKSFFFVIACLLAACSSLSHDSLTTVVEDQGVEVVLTREVISITNRSPNAIYFTIYPAEILPYIEWYPCDDPQFCLEALLPVSKTIELALEPYLEDETEELAVFWWRLVENLTGDGYIIEDFTGMTVPLP
jgi:hypothetical protein